MSTNEDQKAIEAGVQPPPGQAPYGQPPPGQPPCTQPLLAGQTPYPQPQPGQPPYAQPPYAQPPPGQTPYPQPPPGQTPYAQPPPGQAPYPQPPPGQAPYPQPPPGQAAYAGQIQYAGQPPPGQYYQQPVQPIVQPPGAPGQPGGAPAAQWMPMSPQGIAGCPPGLEYLTQLDQLLVHQKKKRVTHSILVTTNHYHLKTSLGQQVYFASEDEGNQRHRQMYNVRRGFVLHINDNQEREVMRVTREFKFCAGCGCCCCAGSDGCAMEVSVEAPVGTVIGYVRQAPGSCPPRFNIQDANKTDILKIAGPRCICCRGWCCQWDREFNVTNLEETTTVGQITRQSRSIAEEMQTKGDNYNVTFPMDLDVKVKATMIGAVFLIDFMYFERPPSERDEERDRARARARQRRY